MRGSLGKGSECLQGAQLEVVGPRPGGNLG